MKLLITRQLLQFLQSVLLGVSAGAFYDFLRPFRALFPRLTPLFDFLYGLALTVTVSVFLLRPADGELRGYMLFGAVGGAVVFFGALSRPLRPVWRFWAETASETVRLALTPLACLKIFLKKLAAGVKNLFYFAGKCYTITKGPWDRRFPRDGGGRVRQRGGVTDGAKKKQSGTQTAASCQRRGYRTGRADTGRNGVEAHRTADSVGNCAVRARPLSRAGGRTGAGEQVSLRRPRRRRHG